MARTGRPFANLDPPQINTKMCDKRALLSAAQPKGYATGRRWVRLKGVTVTRSYVNTDEHWQSMSINGDQYQSMEINRDQWQNIVELSNRAVVLPFNTGGAHGGPVHPRRRANFGHPIAQLCSPCARRFGCPGRHQWRPVYLVTGRQAWRPVSFLLFFQ